MKKTPKLLALGALLLIAAVALVAGCGGSDSSTSTSESAGDSDAATSTATGSADATLTVDAEDFKFVPADAETTAGNVDITVPNKGAVEHELIIAKTDLAPDALPTNSDGTVDEEKLDIPGEVADIAAGDTGTGTVALKPGSYVMFCNLPGHYAQGMYGSLTVK